MAANKTKKESKYYTVKTVEEKKQQIEDKIRGYNEKFVKKNLDKGRQFLTELKADPLKRIDDLIDDGRDTLKRTRKERVDAWREAVKNTKATARKRFDKINAEGKKVYKGIGNDARLIIEDAIEMGRKKLEKIPVVKTVERKVSSGIESIPSKLNLPSREDIDHLVSGIDGVSRKVDALNKEFA